MITQTLHLNTITESDRDCLAEGIKRLRGSVPWFDGVVDDALVEELRAVLQKYEALAVKWGVAL